MVAALSNFDRLSCAAHKIINASNNATKPKKLPDFPEFVSNCKKKWSDFLSITFATKIKNCIKE